MRTVVGVCLLLISACGAVKTPDLLVELSSNTQVIELGVGDIKPVGTDVLPTGRATDVDVFDLVPGMIYTPLDDTPELPDPLRVYRNPRFVRPVGEVASGAARLLVLLRASLDPTDGGVEYEASIIALGEGGLVTDSDFDPVRLDQIMNAISAEGLGPAEGLGILIRAVVRSELGKTVDDQVGARLLETAAPPTTG